MKASVEILGKIKLKISLKMTNLAHKALVALKIFPKIVDLKVINKIFQEISQAFLKALGKELAT